MESVIHSSLSGRGLKPLSMTAQDCRNFKDLAAIGINISEKVVREMMDSADLPVTSTSGSITTPIQFLQAWLPGFVQVITAPRKIDELIGIDTVGDWHDEEVVQGIIEPTGLASLYGDNTNVPLASWNTNFERRTIVRFEGGFTVGRLEEARAGRVNINSAAQKRNAATLSLEINRNRIGFYGYNNGANRTYGFLNDPALPAYISVPTGASGATGWDSKTFLEITADIRTLANQLFTQSKSLIDMRNTETTLALPVGAATFLSVTSDYGISVQDWIDKTYPKMRIVAAPELDIANGGVSAAYLYAEKIEDGSTDGGKVFLHAVPTKFVSLGTEQRAKGLLEDFSNATAGVMNKRPYAVVRATGL